MTRRSSLRVRITAAFAVFFTIGALVLLSAAYLIVARSTSGTVRPDSIAVTITGQSDAAASDADAGDTTSTTAQPTAAAVQVDPKSAASVVPLAAVQQAQSAQSADDLRRVLWWFVAALVVVVGLSIGAGWLAAGRALAPLRRITASARNVSDATLDARLALDGPRDELRELGDTFDAMLARLQRAFAAQRRFVADASHELRTPLALARTEAELAVTDPHATPEQLREALEEIHQTMLRGGALVDALLQLAQAGAALPATEPVRLDAIVQEAVAAAAAPAAAGGVTLDVHADEPVTLPGRAALLRALVDNLLANAIAYNVPAGWVRVTLRREHDAARLTVANPGPVIDPDNVDELFDPFVRAERSRSRRSGGAGLGLAIVRAVAIAHGATVTARPRSGGGLEVELEIPQP